MGLLLVALLTSGLALGGTQIQWPVQDSSFLGSWPEGSEWRAVNALNDFDDGVTNPVTEFVGNDTYPGFYIAKKAVSGKDYLFFRIRVQYPGDVTAPTGKPADPFNNGSILLLINKSDTLAAGTPAYAFAWDFQSTDPTKHGLELMKLPKDHNATPWNGINMDDVDGNVAKKLYKN